MALYYRLDLKYITGLLLLILLMGSSILQKRPGNLHVNMASIHCELSHIQKHGEELTRDGVSTGAAQNRGVESSGRGEEGREGKREIMWRSRGSGLDV